MIKWSTEVLQMCPGLPFISDVLVLCRTLPKSNHEYNFIKAQPDYRYRPITDVSYRMWIYFLIYAICGFTTVLYLANSNKDCSCRHSVKVLELQDWITGELLLRDQYSVLIFQQPGVYTMHQVSCLGQELDTDSFVISHLSPVKPGWDRD